MRGRRLLVPDRSRVATSTEAPEATRGTDGGHLREEVRLEIGVGEDLRLDDGLHV